jgi:TonB-dependent SusC/RagA subfamily outer membrane receptor
MKWNKILMLVFAVCLSQIGVGQKAGKGSDKPITITGKVLNRENKPVAGAVLYIDNVNTGSTTRNNGSYKIKISPSAQTLEVRSSEFGNSSVAINGMTLINFLLDNNGSKVNPGGKSDEASLAPPVEKHKPVAKKINTYNNIYEMIRGEVNGVIVTGTTIQIHQAHSFFGSGAPLYVVNGVVVPSIGYISPLDVKSISLLKGSSAAIYGTEGSNGVIVITLKNGTEKEQ